MTARALRVVEANARVYRRTWRGSVISTFLQPVLFLLSWGLVVGGLVDQGAGDLGVPYLSFLAPGLLAATAMQTGAGDGAYPVMAGLKWRKTFQAVISTPVTTTDLVVGHVAWVGVRLLFVTVVYAGVMAAFGAVPWTRALLGVPPAVLTGLAFAAPVTAYTAWLDSESGLASLFRFGILPLFLFSGTFFPVSQLPDWLEPVAWVVPLWHGVAQTRALTLGTAPPVSPLVSVVYLAALVVAGTAVAVRLFRRRLEL